MLLSESKRDEYVTHLALDLGYNDDEIRKAVEEAGFEPLDPEPTKEERQSSCQRKLQDDLNLIKSKISGMLWKQVQFNDFEYNDIANTTMQGFTFTLSDGTEFTCWGNAYGDEVDDYNLMPTKDVGSPGVVAITAPEYDPGLIATEFRKKYLTVAR
jgi:hypothetical protein